MNLTKTLLLLFGLCAAVASSSRAATITRTNNSSGSWDNPANWDTGKHAYDILGNEKINLALLDVDLPDANGFAICLWLRAQQGLASLPVIFCTGHDVVHAADRARTLNAGFLAKPFLMHKLFVCVQTAADGRPILNQPS